MKVISLPRQCGKTFEMIKLSSLYNAPIVCANERSKKNILDYAKKLNAHIPSPIIVSEIILQSERYGKPLDNVLIDDADQVISSLFYHLNISKNVSALSISEDNSTLPF